MRVMIGGRASGLALAAVVGLALANPAPAGPTTRNDSQEQGLSEEQRREIQPLVEVVGAALRGQLVAAERPFEWANDFLKGAEGNTYVPFTLSVDRAKLSTPSVAMYLYVAHRRETTPDRAGDPQNEPQPAAEQPDRGAFVDAYLVELAEPEEGAPYRISRAFAVPGGDYDVYVALKERGGSVQADEEAAKVMMMAQPLTVPNLWADELATSTIIMAERVEPLSAPLSPEEQVANPYTMGTTRIVPAVDADYGQKEELSLIFIVYNPTLDEQRKPDVTVEYEFHQRTDAGEEYFNKTNPQNFNAQTLPPGFDFEAGHQLVAGQAVPLSLFHIGDYRLEIKVTDNGSGATVTRNVSFTVVGS